MHPEVTATEAGRCRKCGMALVAGDPFDTREVPASSCRPRRPAIKPGVRIKMIVYGPSPWNRRSRHQDFEIVHEKRFHLFVVSRDMDVFEHIHPEQQPDGPWKIEVKLPKARLLSAPVGLPPDRWVAAVHRAHDGDDGLRRGSRVASGASRAGHRSDQDRRFHNRPRRARAVNPRGRSVRPSDRSR